MYRRRLAGLLLLGVAALPHLPGTTRGADQEVQVLKVGTINFEGDQAFPEKQLRSLLLLAPGKEFTSFTLEESLAALVLFYRRRGFLDIRILRVDREINPERATIDLTIHLREGPQTFLQGVVLEGATAFKSEELQRLVNIPPGRPLNPALLKDLEVRIIQRYLLRGYRYVTVSDTLLFTASRDSARAIFRLIEGPVVRVGNILVEGNERVKRDFVVKGVTLKPGDVLDPIKIRESQRALYTTGLFRDVSVEEEGVDSQRPVVDLKVRVREDEPRWIDFRLGYDSFNGLRGLVEWGHLNLLRRGETFSTRAQGTIQPFEGLSPSESSYFLALALSQPFFLGSKVRASLALSQEGLDFQSFDQQESAARLTFTRLIRFKETVSWDGVLKSTNIRIASPDDPRFPVPEDIRANVGRQTTTSTTLTYILDRREDIFYPKRSDNLTLRVTLAGGPLPGEVNFYRAIVDYARYFSTRLLLPEGVLASHIKLGFVEGFSTVRPVPPSEQFTLGGANSVRGFREASVEPRPLSPLPGRAPFFGGALLQLNLEERFRIWKFIGGVFFYDVGGLYDEIEDVEFVFKQGFGLGLRYQTPIGPLRLELATTPGRLRSGDGPFLHIGVGQPF